MANLINADKKTWKCKNVGEKHASVILQLEKETIINSIDIGNGNSAFIEVLVGRSSTPDEDFEVLRWELLLKTYGFIFLLLQPRNVGYNLPLGKSEREIT